MMVANESGSGRQPVRQEQDLERAERRLAAVGISGEPSGELQSQQATTARTAEPAEGPSAAEQTQEQRPSARGATAGAGDVQEPTEEQQPHSTTAERLAAEQLAAESERFAAEQLAAESERLAAEQVAEGSHSELEDSGPRDWQRFYLDYRGRFVDACVLQLRGGRVRVSLAQAPSASCSAKRSGQQQKDKASDPALTGTTVWDGAVVLSHYLTETAVLAARPPGLPYPYSGSSLPSVLELGAGTGAVSLALAATRACHSATVTDLSDLLPHLRLNVGRNSALLQQGRLHVQALRWGQEGEADVQRLAPVRPPYDLIVGSDLIYYSYTPETPHSKLLLWTLRRLSGPHTTIFLSLSLHHNPEEVHQFLAWAAEWFHVLRLCRSIPEEWRVPDVLVARLRPRPALVPAALGEGMEAEPAGGNASGKGPP